MPTVTVAKRASLLEVEAYIKLPVQIGADSNPQDDRDFTLL